MAKDKGSKPDKSKTKDKASKSKGGDGGFARPSDAPATGDGWRFETDENIGELFLITPLREQDFKSEEYGDSIIVVADIVHLNEKKPEKSELHEEVFIFGGWTKGATRGYIGERKVLGRLQQGEKVGKKSRPWILEDADDADIKVAQAYMAGPAGFAQSSADKAKGKSKDKGKKKGKGK